MKLDMNNPVAVLVTFALLILFCWALNSNPDPPKSFLPKCPPSVKSASEAQWCDFSH